LTKLVFQGNANESDNDFSISFLNKNRGYHCACTLGYYSLCTLPSIYPEVLLCNFVPSH